MEQMTLVTIRMIMVLELTFLLIVDSEYVLVNAFLSLSKQLHRHIVYPR